MAVFPPSRRAFVGCSLAGLAPGLTFGAVPAARWPARKRDDPPFQPGTLFVTWQPDPTTTGRGHRPRPRSSSSPSTPGP